MQLLVYMSLIKSDFNYVGANIVKILFAV